jgi:hypothetical protein
VKKKKVERWTDRAILLSKEKPESKLGKPGKPESWKAIWQY